MKIKFAFYSKVFALVTHEHEQEHHITSPECCSTDKKSIQSNYYINNNYDCNHLFFFLSFPSFAFVSLEFLCNFFHSNLIRNHFIIIL